MLKCCFPRRIVLKKLPNDFDNTIRETKKNDDFNNTIRETKKNDEVDKQINHKELIDSIDKDFKSIDLRSESDNEVRTPICENYYEDITKEIFEFRPFNIHEFPRNGRDGIQRPRLNTDNFKWTDDEYSFEEIESFFEEIESSAPNSPSSEISEMSINSIDEAVESDKIDVIKQFKVELLKNIIKNGSIFNYIKTETMNRGLLELIRQISRNKLVEELCEIKDEKDNNIVAAAFVNKNYKAMFYFIFIDHVDIPGCITYNEQKRNFLVCLSEISGRKYILYEVLKKMFEIYPRDIVQKMVVDNDPYLRMNLIKRLVDLHVLVNQKDKPNILKCITLLMEKCPSLEDTMYYISGSGIYINLITYIMLLKKCGIPILIKIIPYLNQKNVLGYLTDIDGLYKHDQEMRIEFQRILCDRIEID